VIGLRRRTISKISALCLVALGLLPFTAPFKTFDFASSRSDGSHDSLPKDKVDPDEQLASPPDESLIPPHLTIVGVAPFTRPSQHEEHPFFSMALRL
jgi:hypothetical protein